MGRSSQRLVLPGALNGGAHGLGCYPSIGADPYRVRLVFVVVAQQALHLNVRFEGEILQANTGIGCTKKGGKGPYGRSRDRPARNSPLDNLTRGHGIFSTET
jgi:hypothetical protein